MSTNNITIEAVYLEKGAGNKKATVYFNYNGAIVVRASVMNSQNGLFVGLPRSKYTNKDGEDKYTDEVRFVKDSSGADEIRNAVMAAYEDAVKNGDTTTKPKPAATGTGTGFKGAASGNAKPVYGNRTQQTGAKAKTSDAPF